MDSNTATILSTLIGGLLTALGGFVANYYVQKSNDQAVKRKEAREIIEQIYGYAVNVEKEILNLVANKELDSINETPKTPEENQEAIQTLLSIMLEARKIEILSSL